LDRRYAPRFEGAAFETSDKTASLRYIPFMPAKVVYPPLIRPKGLRGTVPLKAIRKAVREVVEMEKNDPAAYKAMVKRNAHRKIRIVPDRG
jgi:hypothetical protein